MLLHAGTGPQWRFTEAADATLPAQGFSRSEGLGVASFHASMAGLFSSDPTHPLQADALGLQRVTAAQLAQAFQVSASNPLHQPGDELIVEWRALTVALFDELAPLVRSHLGLSAAQMPLACVLEGGTWAAGRVLAQRLHNGSPPLNIDSDGTEF